ncbi:MAG: MerR family transcriptional regulator [Nitrospiria bacterium]
MQEKLFYKISEVSRQTGLEPYVIRFWETEFPTLHPRKSKGNQRTYTKKEIDLILEIKRLLYQEKLTIPGARKRLKQTTSKGRRDGIYHTISSVKKELEALIHLLR